MTDYTDKKERLKLYDRAQKVFGWEAQERMVFEEAGEFITALAKITRTNNPEDLVQEIADIEIMIEQLKFNMGITDNVVMDVKQAKLSRLCGRLGKRDING